MQDLTASTTLAIAIEVDDFSLWRQANGISPMDAPYRIYKTVGKRKEKHTFIPVGVQKSFLQNGSRRQFAVIYRDLQGKQLESVRVSSTFSDDSFPLMYESVGGSD